MTNLDDPMPKYKLTYFATKGRAETARMIFAVAGVDCEDERISWANWPAVKESEIKYI